MRHLLLMTLLLSSITVAQEGLTGADEVSLNRDEPGNPIILKTNKLAVPANSTAQHQQTDLNFLKERAKVSSNMSLGDSKAGSFSCPEGTELTCLSTGLGVNRIDNIREPL